MYNWSRRRRLCDEHQPMRATQTPQHKAQPRNLVPLVSSLEFCPLIAPRTVHMGVLYCDGRILIMS
jgi:hypothetical protein